MPSSTDREHLEAAERPRDVSARGWKGVGKRTFAQIQADRLPLVAAGLAFYAMLSVFPALIAAVSIYGLVADPATVQSHLDSVTSALPESAAGLVTSQIEGIVGSSSTALGWAAAVAIAGALWTASGGVQQLITAVNIAYDEDDSRGFFALRGVALALTLGVIVVALLALGAIVVVPPLLDGWDLASGWEWAISIGRFVVLGVVVVFALSIVYRFGPDRARPRWRWVSWGAVIATLGWIAASILFTVYVSNFGTFNETYGSLAGVIVLLLWFYISGFMVLLGAELNAELEHQTTADTTTGRSRPVGSRGAVKADTTPGTSQT